MKPTKYKRRAHQVDDMLRAWCDPKFIAATLDLATNSTMRYVHNLGYSRRYITEDERVMISLYRASKRTETKP
jgi:capsule polysaccharide modification protein KpsS